MPLLGFLENIATVDRAPDLHPAGIVTPVPDYHLLFTDGELGYRVTGSSECAGAAFILGATDKRTISLKLEEEHATRLREQDGWVDLV